MIGQFSRNRFCGAQVYYPDENDSDDEESDIDKVLDGEICQARLSERETIP